MISRDSLFNRPDSEKPPLKEANFYLKATMVCPDCGHQEDVIINLDKEVYHECDRGNVRAIVPELKLPTKQETHVKLLRGKSK